MKTTLALLVSALAVAGCQDTTAERPVPTQRDVYSSARLETAPIQVRATFRQDYPTATVTNVETVSPQNGPLLYVITFTEAGQPGSASYMQDGARFRADAAPGRAPVRETVTETTVTETTVTETENENRDERDPR